MEPSRNWIRGTEKHKTLVTRKIARNFFARFWAFWLTEKYAKSTEKSQDINRELYQMAARELVSSLECYFASEISCFIGRKNLPACKQAKGKCILFFVLCCFFFFF